MEGKSKEGLHITFTQEVNMHQTNKIYIGNLAYCVTEKRLIEVFREFGPVQEVLIVKEKETGRSKGFAFVRFDTAKQASDALCLNGKELEGRAMVVNMARPKSQCTLRDFHLRARYKDLGLLL